MTSHAEPTSPNLSFRKRWVPHPLLTLVLVGLWMALVNNYETSGWIFGVLFGLAIPLVTKSIWDSTAKIGSFGSVLIFGLIVAWDVAMANIQVAFLVLFRPSQRLKPAWVTVPLDLRSREGIAVLAGTVTLTPGTVSCDLSADGSSLLVHCLDVRDVDAVVARIKRRYESRLLRIFK